MNDSLAVELFNASFSLGVEIGSYCLVFVVVGCLLAICLKGLR